MLLFMIAIFTYIHTVLIKGLETLLVFKNLLCSSSLHLFNEKHRKFVKIFNNVFLFEYTLKHNLFQ